METTIEERESLRSGCLMSRASRIRLANDADRLAAIERDIRELIETRSVVTAMELRAILDPPEGQ